MSALRKAPDLAEVSLGGAVYLLALSRLDDDQTPTVLEGSAQDIWARVDGVRSVTEIVESLLTGNADLDARIRTDVLAFVEGLRQRGFLE